METDSLNEQVKGRLLGVFSDVQNVAIHPSSKQNLDLSFEQDGFQYRFWLKRLDRCWFLDQYRVNGSPQEKIPEASHDRFEQVVAYVIQKASSRKPKVELIELRCPEDSRRLFAKLIVHHQAPRNDIPNRLEISCPQCKRSTGQVTMHIFNTSDGTLLKTEAIKPWVRREPKKWIPDAEENSRLRHDQHPISA